MEDRSLTVEAKCKCLKTAIFLIWLVLNFFFKVQVLCATWSSPHLCLIFSIGFYTTFQTIEDNKLQLLYHG